MNQMEEQKVEKWRGRGRGRGRVKVADSPGSFGNQEGLGQLVQAEKQSSKDEIGGSGTLAEFFNDNEMELYDSLGMLMKTPENKLRPSPYFRLDAIHMRGTIDMSTRGVREYFDTRKPCVVERINEVSCNIVWADSESAAEVMSSASKPILIEEIDLTHDDDSYVNTALEAQKAVETFDYNAVTEVCSSQVLATIPSKFFWRMGRPSMKSSGSIIMRFATILDKTEKYPGQHNEYCKRYGHPVFQGIQGLYVSTSEKSCVMKNRKQPLQVAEEEEYEQWRLKIRTKFNEHYEYSDEDLEYDDIAENHGRKKIFRLKMRADDEGKAQIEGRNHLNHVNKIYKSEADTRTEASKPNAYNYLWDRGERSLSTSNSDRRGSTKDLIHFLSACLKGEPSSYSIK